MWLNSDHSAGSGSQCLPFGAQFNLPFIFLLTKMKTLESSCSTGKWQTIRDDKTKIRRGYCCVAAYQWPPEMLACQSAGLHSGCSTFPASLFLCLAKQQNVAVVLRLLPPTGRCERVAGSWLWSGPAPDATALWQVSQQMEALPVSLLHFLSVALLPCLSLTAFNQHRGNYSERKCKANKDEIRNSVKTKNGRWKGFLLSYSL